MKPNKLTWLTLHICWMHRHIHSFIRTTCNKVLWKWNRWKVTSEHITHFYHFLSTTLTFFVCFFLFCSLSLYLYLHLSHFQISFLCLSYLHRHFFHPFISLVFGWQSSLMPACGAKLRWIEQQNEGNEDKMADWVTVLRSKTTYTFDSGRLGSCLGTALDDKPTKWEEHFANRFCKITAINERTGLVTCTPFGMGKFSKTFLCSFVLNLETEFDYSWK